MVSESFQASKKLLARTVSSITDVKEQLLNLKKWHRSVHVSFFHRKGQLSRPHMEKICVDGGDRRGSRTRGIRAEHTASTELLEAASS
jgi:hypothetical protein